MLLLLVAMFCNAQMQDPVKFTAQLKTGNTAEGEIVFSGKIQKGWHVYSTNLGSDGPIEASFHVDKKDGVELVGIFTCNHATIQSRSLMGQQRSQGLGFCQRY